MTFKVHFSEENWIRIRQDWSDWWAGDLDRPLIMVDGIDISGKANFALSAVKKWLKIKNYTYWNLVNQPLPTLFPIEVSAEEVIEAYSGLLSSIRFYGDSWPRWWFNFGPGIIAGFLGARVNCTPTTVWFDSYDPVDISTWHPVYIPDNPWRKRIEKLTQLALESWGEQLTLGFTDFGGNLDILASFRSTQQLLLDIVDIPEVIERLVGEITPVWLRYYNEFYGLIKQNCRGTTPWAHIWSAGRCYMYQSDFSYMISPKMFERFVMPDLEACCMALDHNFYHLDGKGAIRHLDMLLSIKRLNGIQWIPGDGAPPPEEWLPLLKRIRDGGKLCQLYVSPQGALRIIRELGGKGFALYVLQPMSPEDADGFLKQINLESL